MGMNYCYLSSSWQAWRLRQEKLSPSRQRGDRPVRSTFQACLAPANAGDGLCPLRAATPAASFGPRRAQRTGRSNRRKEGEAAADCLPQAKGMTGKEQERERKEEKIE